MKKVYIEKKIGYSNGKSYFIMIESNYTKEDVLKRIEEFKLMVPNFISIYDNTIKS